MSCPKAVSGEVKVLDLINEDNDATLVKDMVVFEAPAAQSEGERNTSLLVKSTETSPYGGNVEVLYDRIDLGTLFHGLAVHIVISGDPSLADKICGINADYGTDFDAAEFEAVEVDEKAFILKAKETSLAYVGEVLVEYGMARLPLDERLTVNDLDGFGNNYPYMGPSLTRVIYSQQGNFDEFPYAFGNFTIAPEAQRNEGWNRGFATATNGEIEIYAVCESSKWIPGQAATSNYGFYNHQYDPETDTHYVIQDKPIAASQRASISPNIGFMRADRTTTLTPAELISMYDVKVTYISEGAARKVATRVYTLATVAGSAENFQLVPDAASVAEGAITLSMATRSLPNGNRFMATSTVMGIGPANPRIVVPALDVASSEFPANGAKYTRAFGRGSIIVEAVRKMGEASPIRLVYNYETTPVHGAVGIIRQQMNQLGFTLGPESSRAPAPYYIPSANGLQTCTDGQITAAFGCNTRLTISGETPYRDYCNYAHTLGDVKGVEGHIYDQLPGTTGGVRPGLNSAMLIYGEVGEEWTMTKLLDLYDFNLKIWSSSPGITENFAEGVGEVTPGFPNNIRFVGTPGVTFPNGSFQLDPATNRWYWLVRRTMRNAANTNYGFLGMRYDGVTAGGYTTERIRGYARVMMTLTPKLGGEPIVVDFNLKTNPLQ